MVDSTGDQGAAPAKPAPEMVRLRNGTEEFAPLVATVMLTVHRLFDSKALPDLLALYDLTRFAHDRKYDPSFTRQRLIELALLEANGHMHDSIRNIVVSSLSLEGQDIRMVNPAAP